MSVAGGLGARVVGIWGARGSGKSTKALAIARTAPRLVIFDTLHNTGKGVHRLATVRDQLLRRFARPFVIVYKPPVGRLPEALSELSKLLRQVMQAGGARVGPLTLYVEEMSLCYPQQQLPATVQGFTELALVGRHDRISIIGVAQRPAQVGKAFVGNTDETYVFRPNGPADIATAQDLVGAQHAAAIRGLKNFEFVHKDHTTGAVHYSATGNRKRQKT